MSRPSTPLLTAVFLLLCLIWGTTWAAIKLGLRGIPPFSGVALRFAIAGALILLLAAYQRVRLGQSRRERVLWLVQSVLTFSGSYGIVYWCEQWVPSGLAAVLFATYPFFVAVLAHFLLPAEPLSAGELGGILLGFSGVGVIFSDDLSALGGPGVRLAAAVLLLSPLISAVASVAVKRWGGGVHPFSLTGVPMAITACLMGTLALTLEGTRSIHWDATSIATLLYLAILGSALTFTLYYWLLARLPAKRLALIAYVIPVVAVIVGTLWGEPLTARTLAGSALVIIGVALAVQRFARSARSGGA